MSSSAARERWRAKRTKVVEDFCREYNFSLNPLNHGYQLRIENLLDVYPTNGRHCILQTGERGDWETPADLKQLMLKALPSVRVYEVDKGEQPVHGVHVTGVNTIKEYDVTPPTPNPYQPSVLENVKVISIEQYNKWYRRLWRWLSNQPGGHPQ